MKKIYLYVGVVVITVVSGLFFLGFNKMTQKTEENPSPTPVASSSPGANLFPKPKISTKPEIVFSDEHQNLVAQYDYRIILLAADCQSANPSWLDFKNGTEIVLDNFLSDTERTIKLGDKSYTIPAHRWVFLTLTSTTLPTYLPMFCGEMQLGQIGIIK